MRIIEDLHSFGLSSVSEPTANSSAGSNSGGRPMPLSSGVPASRHGASQRGSHPDAFQNMMAPAIRRGPLPQASLNGFKFASASHAAPGAPSMQNGHAGPDATNAPAPIYPMTSLEARAQGMLPGRALLARHSGRPVVAATPVGPGGKLTAFEGAFARMAPAAPGFSFQTPAAITGNQHTITRASFQNLQAPVQMAPGTAAAMNKEPTGISLAPPRVPQLSETVRRAASLGSVLTKASMVLSAQQRQQHLQQHQQQLLEGASAPAQHFTGLAGYRSPPGAHHLGPNLHTSSHGPLPAVAETSQHVAGAISQAGFPPLPEAIGPPNGLSAAVNPVQATRTRSAAFSGAAGGAKTHQSPMQAMGPVFGAQQPLMIQQPNGQSAATSVPGSAPLVHFGNRVASPTQEQLLESTREYRRQQAVFSRPRDRPNQVKCCRSHVSSEEQSQRHAR